MRRRLLTSGISHGVYLRSSAAFTPACRPFFRNSSTQHRPSTPAPAAPIHHRDPPALHAVKLNQLHGAASAGSSNSNGSPELPDSPRSTLNDGNSAMGMALGVALGTALLGCAGVAYFHWYKWNTLRKIEIAFEGGYDPVLELEKAAQSPSAFPPKPVVVSVDGEEVADDALDMSEARVRRKEQDTIDRIMRGEEKGHYHLILGPKGSGKTSMMIQAMLENDAEGVAVCEAHEDPDVFRLRFGKALNFEFNEDSANGLFQRRDPKEAGPLLDIERAMSKLEKVAIRYRQKHGRPIILVFNNVHFFNDDDTGKGLLHMIQQRAESWAASNCANIVMASDDFRQYDVLKKNANRMEVLSVKDLDEKEAISAVQAARGRYWGERISPVEAKKVYDLVGGRLGILNSLAKRKNMLGAAKDRLAQEKQWLLSKIGLIPDHDDDVMDEQKWSSCSWLLLQELVRQAERTDDPHAASDPKVTWFRAREVMTRPDFINDLDHLNIIQIDTHYNVRPDSKLLLNVMKEIVHEEDFQERLDSVRERVDEIESLHRTRELTLKDPPDAENVFKIMLAPPHQKKKTASGSSGWFTRYSSKANDEEDD